MEENTVVTNAAIEETPQADAAVVDEQPTETVDTPQAETPTDAEPQADAADRLFTRQEFDEAVRRKA